MRDVLWGQIGAPAPGRRERDAGTDAAAGMSRSGFFETFRKEIGHAPMEYVAYWRSFAARVCLPAHTQASAFDADEDVPRRRPWPRRCRRRRKPRPSQLDT
ncbi:hypothetical protein GCM10011322_44440 [Salinarimonas ramus]|uniref:HTH araC/xylS-type domain-containing protein n=1 Tax=Salinarimonas ramus TaxID=690164 RepID=A0A917QIZ4_9HYPH|nr:hypothetical protein GCM10011322_44440 [Salinarimonas ramus]